jgi:hypothetical protein
MFRYYHVIIRGAVTQNIFKTTADHIFRTPNTQYSHTAGYRTQSTSEQNPVDVWKHRHTTVEQHTDRHKDYVCAV